MRERKKTSTGSGAGVRRPERRSPERDEGDIFISEVNEELQRERLTRLARRYGPYLLGAIVALVVGVAVYEINRGVSQQAAYEAGGALIAAEGGAQPAERLAALAEDAGDAQVVAQLLAAARFSDGVDGDDDLERAAALYASVAANAEAAPRYRDAASVRSAMLAGEDVDPLDIVGRLAEATGPGRPYRAIALELTANAYLRAGDVENARAALIDARDDAATLDSAVARISDQLEALEDGAAAPRAEPETPAPTGEETAPSPADDS